MSSLHVVESEEAKFGFQACLTVDNRCHAILVLTLWEDAPEILKSEYEGSVGVPLSGAATVGLSGKRLVEYAAFDEKASKTPEERTLEANSTTSFTSVCSGKSYLLSVRLLGSAEILFRRRFKFKVLTKQIKFRIQSKHIKAQSAIHPPTISDPSLVGNTNGLSQKLLSRASSTPRDEFLFFRENLRIAAKRRCASARFYLRAKNKPRVARKPSQYDSIQLSAIRVQLNNVQRQMTQLQLFSVFISLVVVVISLGMLSKRTNTYDSVSSASCSLPAVTNAQMQWPQHLLHHVLELRERLFRN